MTDLADRVEAFIPRGDGYNLDYANTLTEAVEVLRAKSAPAEVAQGEAVEVVGWRRSDRPYHMTAYPSVCATWHRHGFPVEPLYTAPPSPDAELVELLRNMVDLAGYWINRTDTRGMSKADYMSWVALGHESKALLAAYAKLASL